MGAWCCSAAVNTMMLVDTGSASLLVSGDDDGTIKLWDVRQQSSVGEYKHHGDFISGLTSVEDKKLILASRFFPHCLPDACAGVAGRGSRAFQQCCSLSLCARTRAMRLPLPCCALCFGLVL